MYFPDGKNIRYLVAILTNGNIFIFICSGGQLDLSTDKQAGKFQFVSWV